MFNKSQFKRGFTLVVVTRAGRKESFDCATVHIKDFTYT